MPDLTAKVFRTFNASFTLQQELDKMPDDIKTDDEKLLFFNRANRQVAILCNHQRTLPKTFPEQVARLEEKVYACARARVCDGVSVGAYSHTCTRRSRISRSKSNNWIYIANDSRRASILPRVIFRRRCQRMSNAPRFKSIRPRNDWPSGRSKRSKRYRSWCIHTSTPRVYVLTYWFLSISLSRRRTSPSRSQPPRPTTWTHELPSLGVIVSASRLRKSLPSPCVKRYVHTTISSQVPNKNHSYSYRCVT